MAGVLCRGGDQAPLAPSCSPHLLPLPPHSTPTLNTEYLLSICGDQALRELPSPGKSGSVFFLSHDDRFIIKTMRKEEVKGGGLGGGQGAAGVREGVLCGGWVGGGGKSEW